MAKDDYDLVVRITINKFLSTSVSTQGVLTVSQTWQLSFLKAH
ncbi:hypothetical protein [Lactobacillus iners]|nr:hypothetical protein [Lactobacillus iners]MCT7676938.1 hypothetical protein [Lactobacillus iners]MCT7683518.1 hypothetical protein [Lactobacillus iners]MCT7692001.1 hypothetical protein [Lactobacillus iners]MCT7734506.1 hypothetical protein [Lactobacillus iners]MCT7735204.1 hypothetical protein [Lactobacillus iners]